MKAFVLYRDFSYDCQLVRYWRLDHFAFTEKSVTSNRRVASWARGLDPACPSPNFNRWDLTLTWWWSWLSPLMFERMIVLVRVEIFNVLGKVRFPNPLTAKSKWFGDSDQSCWNQTNYQSSLFNHTALLRRADRRERLHKAGDLPSGGQGDHWDKIFYSSKISEHLYSPTVFRCKPSSHTSYEPMHGAGRYLLSAAAIRSRWRLSSRPRWWWRFWDQIQMVF